MKAQSKNIIRDIRSSLGRYIAILGIIGLGVGFFCGIKSTKEAVIQTASSYFERQNFYSLELVSQVGFTEDQVESFSSSTKLDAEGSFSLDKITEIDGSSKVIHLMSLPSAINKPILESGRLPSSEDEILVDSRFFKKSQIGSFIDFDDDQISPDFPVPTTKRSRYKISGLCSSPLYISYERGTSLSGLGEIYSYGYILPSQFNFPLFTEIYTGGGHNATIYSGDEKNNLKELEKSALSWIKSEDLANKVTILDRYTNIGYATLDSDTDIINSIAKVFPLFFFLVAALVCMTTMTRMVDDERSQIGTLKALGYSTFSSVLKYLFYSTSSALVGSIFGFTLGTYVFPRIIWRAYNQMYHFIDQVDFVILWPLASLSIFAAILCALGSTLVASLRDFMENPAQLIRPKAPPIGKKIFLERLTCIWKHLSFLQKVSLRNIFRYKKRLFMMLIGISGSTALIVTAFGIDNSIGDIGKYQFEEICHYDQNLHFTKEVTSKEFRSISKDVVGKLYPTYQHETTLSGKNKSHILTLVALDERNKNLSDYITLTSSTRKLTTPKPGDVYIDKKTAKTLGVNVGDNLTIPLDSTNHKDFLVSNIVDNYVGSFAYINKADVEGHDYNSALYKGDIKNFSSLPLVLSAQSSSEQSSRINKMLKSLGQVIAMLVICASILAFIVIYNLTNINIMERIREVATIRVLGFTIWETNTYIFRENLILTSIGGLLGLVLGKYLLAYVINEINVKMIFFDARLSPISYLLSLAITMAIAILVNLFSFRRITKIQLAESLKAVE